MKNVLRGAEQRRRAGMKQADRERAERMTEGQRHREVHGQKRAAQVAERRQQEEFLASEKLALDVGDLENEEASWARLEAKMVASLGSGVGCAITLVDLPGLHAGAMRARLATGEAKKVFKELNLRWHPDKFMPKYGSRVSVGELEEVREVVTKTWRNLRGYHMKYEEGIKAAAS